MTMRQRKAFLALVFAAGLSFVLLKIHGGRSVSNSVNANYVMANNRLGFRLSGVLRRQPSNNMMLSPVGLTSVLSLAYDGASGPTREALGKTLGIEGMTPRQVDSFYASLLSQLMTPIRGVQVEISNSVWIAGPTSVDSKFVQSSKDFYRAEIVKGSATSPVTASRMNSWIQSKTHGQLKGYPLDTENNDCLSLISAVYFKADWASSFDEKRTRLDPFHYLDGTSRYVPMMSQAGRFEYYEEDDFKAMILPYRGRRFQMVIFLPVLLTDTESFAAKFTADNWQHWKSKFREERLQVNLPRFRMTSMNDLAEPLKTLGLGLMFDRDLASFGGLHSLAQGQIWVSRMGQLGSIDVNEQGTVAGAVTFGGFACKASPRAFVVDHPFFFLIEDKKSEAILFMGWVADPTEGLEEKSS